MRAAGVTRMQSFATCVGKGLPFLQFNGNVTDFVTAALFRLSSGEKSKQRGGSVIIASMVLRWSLAI